MSDEIDKALADAIYPQVRDTHDRKLRAEAIKRAGKARAVLAGAGFVIVPAPLLPEQETK
jgi:hypothetical protein